MLEVTDVTVHHGQVVALRGVSLRVDKGELVSVIGPNGAGKSTLLMTVAGALVPTSGSVTFNGSELDHGSPEDVVGLGIALVPERRRIFTTLSVEENLRLGMSMRSDKGDRQSALTEVLERFPILAERYKVPATTLSGGEQQQLAIARALVARPQLLLVDEPSLGLAPKIVGEILDVMVQLRDEGTTILLVEQNARRAIAISGRSYLLELGEIRREVSSQEAASTETDFLTSYLGSSG